MTKVVHCKKEKYDVYIGRGSKWGNPFPMHSLNEGRDRSYVIEKYRKYIMTKPDLLKALPELKGKILGCYCGPLACHGDVLADLADKE